MIEKLNFETQLEKFYENHKRKMYYDTTSIMELTGISIRTIRYRLAALKKKLKNIKSLLFKQNNKWYVHYSQIDYFLPKYKSTTSTLYNQDWKTFITWVMKDSYDDNYHHELARAVKEVFPDRNFYYTIEKTKKGVNHLHMVSDIEKNIIEGIVKKILNQFLNKNDFRLEVGEIMNKVMTINYLKK